MIQAKLRRNQVTPATIRKNSLKLIDTLASEGATSSSEGARRAVLKHWLIAEIKLLGVRVIPNILFEEPHGLIVTSDAPSNIFSQKSKLIVNLIPSYEGALRQAASKLIVNCAFDLNKLIKLILASCH